jgi:hypothetical protein
MSSKLLSKCALGCCAMFLTPTQPALGFLRSQKNIIYILRPKKAARILQAIKRPCSLWGPFRVSKILIYKLFSVDIIVLSSKQEKNYNFNPIMSFQTFLYTIFVYQYLKFMQFLTFQLENIKHFPISYVLTKKQFHMSCFCN